MARILIVDDDRAVRTTVSLLLNAAGHEIVEAADGRVGLAKIDAEPFDLLIIDIFMPDMDRNPALPIIVVSGMLFRTSSTQPPDFLAMATKLGAVHSLRKPFKAHELLAKVEDCLSPSGRCRA
jgi:CheY-like chemotaxis protein